MLWRELTSVCWYAQGRISNLGVLPAVLELYLCHMRDSNTVVASGIAGIVCNAEGVGLREDFMEEAG